MRTPDATQPVAVTVDVLEPGTTVTSEAVTGDSAAAGSGSAAPIRSPALPARRLRFVPAAVLLLALACVIVVNRLPGERIAGNPVADWPQPPPVGSCLDLDGNAPRAVPCSGPHDAEVTEAFGVLDPMVTDTSRNPMYDACGAAALDYLGPAANPSQVPGQPDWSFLPLAYGARPLDASVDQRSGRYGWMVCMVQPAVPVRYRGTVRQVTVTDAPAAYRTCLDHRNAAVSCAMPHATEVLAMVGADQGAGWDPSSRPTRDVQGSLEAAMEQVQHQLARRLGECAGIAAALAGTADPTYGGVLNIGISTLSGAPDGLGAAIVASGPAASDGAAGHSYPASASMPLACISQVRDGRLLTGSVVSRGDTPPPLTGR